LHTYSGATAVRTALLLAGFAVGLGEPIGNGRVGTIAATSAALLARPFDRRFLDRVARSSAPFPPDAPPDALARIAALLGG
jgi:queuine tRNA-ribosyltransferase